MRWLGFTIALFVCLGTAYADEGGSREQARQYFLAGERHFKAGDYRTAIKDFQSADALVPSALLAYNEALCHDRLGDSAEAARLYRDYLARRPDAPNRAEVEERLAVLARQPRPAPEGDQLARTPDFGPAAAGIPAPVVAPQVPAPVPAAAPPPTASVETRPPTAPAAAQPPIAAAPVQPVPAPQPLPPRPLPEPARPEATPVYKQWWFWVVVGVGVVIVADVAINAAASGGSSSAGHAGKPSASAPGLVLFNF